MAKTNKATRYHKKHFWILLVMGAVLITASAPAVIGAEEGHALVVLKGDFQAISPDPLKVKQGTTIIWVNEGKEPISILIKTKVGIACKNPVNFFADLFGYYETGQVLTGATASICFIEKGKYEYEVKRMVGKEKPVEKILPATIIVE
jgi:plastocyanin